MYGGHQYGKECPLKHQTMKEGENLVQPSVGVLRVLSIVVAEVTKSQKQDPISLNFISAEVNGHTVMVMVDSVVTHNFMKDSVSKRLGLTLEEPPNAIKEVNTHWRRSLARPRTF